MATMFAYLHMDKLEPGRHSLWKEHLNVQKNLLSKPSLEHEMQLVLANHAICIKANAYSAWINVLLFASSVTIKSDAFYRSNLETNVIVTARELFKEFGCSERLYREAFQPCVEVGLFAPAEQCSAAEVLSMLYYYLFSHQKSFDVVWCRGTVQEKILNPWLDFLKSEGCRFHGNKTVTDFIVNKTTGDITGVLCEHDVYEADAFVLAVGISALKSTVSRSQSRNF